MQICVPDKFNSQQKCWFLLFLPVCLLCHCMANAIIISSTVISTSASAVGIHVFSEKECHSTRKKKQNRVRVIMCYL